MTSNTPYRLVDSHGHQYPLARQQTKLGRSSDNQIVIQDAQASRHHATIFAQAGQYFIQDEGSKNGTKLNGRGVAGPHLLQIGDRITIGGTEFVVQSDAAVPIEPMGGGYAIPARQSSALLYIMVGGVAAAAIVFLLVGIVLSVPRPVSQAQLVPTLIVPSPVIPSPVVPSLVIPTPIPPSLVAPSPTASLQGTATIALPTATPTIEPPTAGAVLVPLDADANKILAAIAEMIRASSYIFPYQVQPEYGQKISFSGSPNLDLCNGDCCCGTYVTNKLFGHALSAPSKSWPTADSMDDPDYWTKEDVVGKDNLRVHKDDAQTGDIIIMRANSNIYWVTDPSHPSLDGLHKWKLGSDGHIGFVMEARYRSDLNGWVIKMRSANWGFKSPVAKLNDATCSNVTDAYIFVRNFEQVHFWRRMPPTPEPLPPPPPSPVPPPVIACVAPPTQFDPPDGRTFYARNTILRWKNYELKSGEYFDVQVWPDGGGPKSLGGSITNKNGEWSLPIDDLYAWSLGKYFWKVRVKASDGSYRSCDGNPFSFTLIEKNAPEPPSQPGSSSSSSGSSSSFCWMVQSIWGYYLQCQ